jgi:hypothetical protein
MSTVFQFPVNKLRGVALFAAKGDIRYYLNGVYFTKAANGKGIVAVAMDGHRLTAIYHEQDVSNLAADFAGVIIPTEELERACKFPVKRKGLTDLDIAIIVEGIAVTLKSAITVECKAIEGKFPDYVRVVPKMTGRQHSGFATVNAGYLATYEKLAALLRPGNSTYRSITLSSTDANNSVVVGLGDPNVVCILMPMRGDFDDFSDRDWLGGAK